MITLDFTSVTVRRFFGSNDAVRGSHQELARARSVRTPPLGPANARGGPKSMDAINPEHFIAHSAWRFADTMATIPHEYTVKESGDGRGTALSSESFDWFAAHIQEHGRPGQYRDFPPQWHEPLI